jgi:hypothetical protein
VVVVCIGVDISGSCRMKSIFIHPVHASASSLSTFFSQNKTYLLTLLAKLI